MKQILTFIALLVITGVFITGCKKDNNPVTAAVDDQISADAADVVGDALAVNNGGVVDQMNDVMDMATTGGILELNGLAKMSSVANYDSVKKVFNTADTTWTVYVSRERTNGLTYYGKWYRVFWFQFIGVDGKAQLVRSAQTATVKHKILQGAGIFFTPRLTSYLKSITSDWVATNTNTDTVTINGTFSKSGIDSSKVRYKRIFDHTLTLNFSNVKGPKGTRLNYYLKYSGTITGTYSATVTNRDGKTFTYTKNISIIIGGGVGTYTIDGTAYKVDLATGDRL
jgi:hypothetical protein